MGSQADRQADMYVLSNYYVRSLRGRRLQCLLEPVSVKVTNEAIMKLSKYALSAVVITT